MLLLIYAHIQLPNYASDVPTPHAARERAGRLDVMHPVLREEDAVALPQLHLLRVRLGVRGKEGKGLVACVRASIERHA